MKNKTLLGILLFGSIWGMLEATLGALLHLIMPLSPYTGAIMLSFGVFIMSAGLRTYKPESTMTFVSGIGLTASMLKGFDIFLLGPMPEVINPIFAIVIEALSFGVVVTLLQKHYHKNSFTIPLTGIASAYASHLGFPLVFAYLLKTENWLSKGIGGILAFTLKSGTYAAILCAVTAPLGYQLGESLHPRARLLLERRPTLSYALAGMIIIGCWFVGIAYA
jgi:hypothetical protein